MATITKHTGQAFGIRELRLNYQGPAIQISVVMTLTPAQFIGHGSPLLAPSARRFTSTLIAPARSADGELVLSEAELPLGVFSTPSFEPGKTYDVNVAIGTPQQGTETFSEWWRRRMSDAWDDDVYRYV